MKEIKNVRKLSLPAAGLAIVGVAAVLVILTAVTQSTSRTGWEGTWPGTVAANAQGTSCQCTGYCVTGEGTISNPPVVQGPVADTSVCVSSTIQACNAKGETYDHAKCE